MAKYTLEQLQQRAKGTKTLEELRGETQQTQEEQPKNFFENVGSFVGGVLTDITKPVVQSLASPYQAVATAYNIAKAPSKEKVESETAKTSAVIKRMRELESKGQSKTAEYSNLVSQLKQKSEAYKKTDTFVAPTTIKTGIWGDIEAPKTAEEVLGTGAKTLSLAASPIVGGALWGAGEAMQQNKGLPEVIGYGVTGGALGKAGELAFKALGSVMKVGGKALASSKFGQAAAGTLTATEKNAERVMASLIKPLKKNLNYGKKPALELAREIAKTDKVPGNWEELATFATKAKQKAGKELGNYYNKADKTIKTRFSAKTALETIDGAMDEAAARNNTSLMNRLSELKQALTQNLVKKFDKKTGKWIIKSAGEKDLTKLKPSEVQNLIREISEQVKWTGNYSDDLTVNRALQDTYRTLRKGLEAGITKENKGLGTTIRRLNEKYGNLVSADDAVRYRKGVVNRQALISLTDQEAATAGGLIQSIASGGVNVGTILAGIGSGTLSKFIKSPWFATNLTKAIMKLSPVKRQGILLKYPILRKAIKGMTTATGKALEKTGAFLEGTPSKIKQIQKSPVTGKVIPMGLSIDDVSKQSSKKAGVPKTQTIDAGLAKTIRESKGLSADDIMKKYPDIQLKRDVPAKDIHGNKIEIPKGEVLTPYEVKGNKVVLQDGQTYVVAKNQFQNIKGNSVVKGEAPKLKKSISLPSKKDQLIIKKNTTNASNLTKNGIDIDLQKVERAKNLSGEDRQIETIAYLKIKKEGNKILNDYFSEHGLTTNTDNLRKYFKDVGYNGSNSKAVHEPSSLLKKILWPETLKRATNGEAIIYSGGSGSGKTSVAEKFVSALKRDDTAILDGNLSSLKSAERDIEATLSAGKTPHIVYIFREPLDAFLGTIKRFLTNKKEAGRIVPVSVSSSNHPDSLMVVKQLYEKYGDQIKFTFIDNSLGAGNAKKIMINDVKNIKIPNDIKQKMLSLAKEIYKNGLIFKGKKYKMTSSQYNNLIQ